MGSVTRHPTGQDLVCLVCRKGDNIDIDHVVNRGSGGSKARDVPENKVPLCRECHTAKTNNVLDTHVAELDGHYAYRWRRKVEGAPWQTVYVEVSDRYHCLVLSDGAEGAGGREAPTGSSPGSYSAPSPSTMTHEQRVAIAAEIKDTEWNRQWKAGDTANEWRRELGEEAEQYLDDFGYQPESLSNIMNVCQAISPPLRNDRLRFSHHVVVVGLNREDMEMWLDKCVEESWSVAEFRRQVKGARVRVKRWSLEELRELNERNWYKNEGDNRSVTIFLDWLGDQST